MVTLPVRIADKGKMFLCIPRVTNEDETDSEVTKDDETMNKYVPNTSETAEGDINL